MVTCPPPPSAVSRLIDAGDMLLVILGGAIFANHHLCARNPGIHAGEG